MTVQLAMLWLLLARCSPITLTVNGASATAPSLIMALMMLSGQGIQTTDIKTIHISNGCFDSNEYAMRDYLANFGFHQIDEFVFAEDMTFENHELPYYTFAGLRCKNLRIESYDCWTLGDQCFSFTEIDTLYIANVSHIGHLCFRDAHIKSFDMPGLRSMDDESFFNIKFEEVECLNLYGVELITKYAFDSATVRVIKAPNVRVIQKDAFVSSQIERIELGNITSIGVAAFSTCVKLVSLKCTFSGNAMIDEHAFEGCSSLTEIDISGVEKVMANAFLNCVNLATCKTSNLREIYAYGFSGCSKLATINLAITTSIGDFAFEGCAKLASVSFPEMKSIGHKAFSQCVSIKDIEAHKLVSIGSYAFENCNALQTVVMTTPRIPDGCFHLCKQLKSADLSGLIELGSMSFKDCDALVKVDMSNSNEIAVGERAFENCASLQFVTGNVKLISGYAFKGCSKLVEASFPLVHTLEGDGQFSGCTSLARVDLHGLTGGFDGKNLRVEIFDKCSSLEMIALPSDPSVLGFGNDVFTRTGRSTSSITLCLPSDDAYDNYADAGSNDKWLGLSAEEPKSYEEVCSAIIDPSQDQHLGMIIGLSVGIPTCLIMVVLGAILRVVHNKRKLEAANRAELELTRAVFEDFG